MKDVCVGECVVKLSCSCAISLGALCCFSGSALLLCRQPGWGWEVWDSSGCSVEVQPHSRDRSLSGHGSAPLTRVSCSLASPWASSAYPGKKELREVLAPFSPFLGL